MVWPPDLAIISDDAGQFNVMIHGLCWVHAERLVHKLLPLNDQHREDIARVRGEIWSLYADLKDYKQHPTAKRKRELARRFDAVFIQKTLYATLDRLLRRIHMNKSELLLVLERPEVPLHTNGSHAASGMTAVMPPAELCRPSPDEQGRIRVAPLLEACEAA